MEDVDFSSLLGQATPLPAPEQAASLDFTSLLEASATPESREEPAPLPPPRAEPVLISTVEGAGSRVRPLPAPSLILQEEEIPSNAEAETESTTKPPALPASDEVPAAATAAANVEGVSTPLPKAFDPEVLGSPTPATSGSVLDVESPPLAETPLEPEPEPEPEPADLSEQLSGGFASLVAGALEKALPSAGRELQPHQIPSPQHSDPDSPIKGWVMMAGRNAGKSYAGARWTHRVMSVPGRPKRARIIAPSFGDAVASCIEGPSGILEASNRQAQWKPSHPGGAQVQWPNGSVCFVIGTPTPRDVDRLRAIGNIDYDWFEEAAANPQLPEAERQARLSRRRIGSKWIATTTPKPLPEIRAWQTDPSIEISSATAYDNPYADPLWLEELETMYSGTLLYQQEVLGKVLEDVAGAIWNLGKIERSRLPSLEAAEEQGYTITKVAIGVDPANSSGLTGIVAVALATKEGEFGGRPSRHLLVLEDRSTPGMSAEAWAAEAVRLALRYDAPIVAENDSGGDAIRAVLKGADHLDRATIIPARARGRGTKEVRAEPIAILWERDDYRGHIVGTLPELEEQMTTWVPDDKRTAGPTGSPDRVDALVWACTYLWARSGVEDIQVHMPGASGVGGPALTSGRQGVVAPWNNPGRGRSRHRKGSANSAKG